MKKKAFGLLITLLITSVSATVFASTERFQYDYELARYLYAPFGAITPEQHNAFSQKSQFTDAEVQELLGINNRRNAIITLDRSFLETLTHQELDMLMEPFREIVNSINSRYGTSMDMPYLYQTECWANPDSLRQTFIRVLSGETAFDTWFSSVRENVDIAMQYMQHRAYAAMRIDNRLANEELKQLSEEVLLEPFSSVTRTRTNILFSGTHGNNRYVFDTLLTANVNTDRVGIMSFSYVSNLWSMGFSSPRVTPFRWTWHPNIWTLNAGARLSQCRVMKTVYWHGDSHIMDNESGTRALTNPTTVFDAHDWE